MKSYNNNQPIYPIYIGKKSLTLNTLASRQYAQAVQITSILNQTTKIFLRKNNLSPQQSFQQYLTQSNKGQHVLLKSFGSFNKSTMNRMCFLYNFIKIFELENHQRNGLDYYQLFRLLCSDFPKQVIVKSVNLLIQQPNADLTKILNSRKFINSLYLNFIHTEYLDLLYAEVFENKNQKVSILMLAQWVVQKQKNMIKIHDKPLFSSAIQAIFNQIRKKGVAYQISSNNNFPSLKDSNANKKILFLNQTNCLQYIRKQCPGHKKQQNSKNIKKNQNKSDQFQSESQNSFQQEKHLKSKVNQTQNHNKISYEQFLKQLINQVEYNKWIKQNLQMFQNSIIWAVETYKTLCPKEIGQQPQPINSKKMKKK